MGKTTKVFRVNFRVDLKFLDSGSDVKTSEDGGSGGDSALLAFLLLTRQLAWTSCCGTSAW